MTAPAHPDRQGTREELREALRWHHLVGQERPFRMGSWRCSCGHGCANGYEGYADHLASVALLPVVERLCDQRAAEALEEAADAGDTRGLDPIADHVAGWLRDRADDLRAVRPVTTSGEEGEGAWLR